MADHGALVLVGSGPGVGRGIAAVFAERGFKKIFLLSRDASRLADDATFVRDRSREKAGVSPGADFVPVDVSNAENVRHALAEVERRLDGTPLESVVFNAARTGPSKILEWPAEKLESDLRLTVISLYIAAQWAIPHLIKTADDNKLSPSLLVTSGFLYKDPAPNMFSLAACKAAQYSIVHSLHKQYRGKGVHCALIIIGGTVAEQSKVTNPRGVAEEAWRLHTQKKGEGDLEGVLLDPDFASHVKNREQAK